MLIRLLDPSIRIHFMEFIPVITYLYQMEEEKNIAAEPDLAYTSNTYADYVNFTFDYMVELIRGRIYKMTPAPARITNS